MRALRCLAAPSSWATWSPNLSTPPHRAAFRIASALQLVIGAGEFLGDQVSRALAAEVPVIELNADADDETLADAIGAAEVILNCAQTWSPARRLRFRKGNSSPLLERIVAAARRAKIRGLVHVSA